jgi:putative hemolysin
MCLDYGIKSIEAQSISSFGETMNSFNKPIITIFWIILLVLALTSCSSAPAEPTPTIIVEEEGNDQFIGVPNPASFYCQEMGYELDIRNTDNGQEGVCVFPDGTECEEWTFLTGSCSVEWTFCQRQGGSIEPGVEIGTCVFADGSSCSEYEYFIGECEAPE